jgi:L-threonylcarbamoyladenylate synthase
MKTVLVEKENITEIVRNLQAENVIAFPTETVFGLGILWHSKVGLEKIYALKHREETKAITLMVGSKEDIDTYAYVGKQARKVIEKYMPGKLTLILQKKECIDKYVTTNLSTIGIRIPDDPFVLAVLQKVGPMWVTSANISGADNLTTAQDVYQVFNGKIPVVVNGKTPSSTASTVVDMQDDTIHILRSGEITKEMLEEGITK